VIPATDQPVLDPAGNSVVVVVVGAAVAEAENAACGGPGVAASVGPVPDVEGPDVEGPDVEGPDVGGPDVGGLAEEAKGAGEEAAWSERTVEIVPGQTAGERSVPVVVVVAAVFVVVVAAAVAVVVVVAAAVVVVVVVVVVDGPVPGATAWTAVAGGLAGTAAGISGLGS